jgi:hypothetical protein
MSDSANNEYSQEEWIINYDWSDDDVCYDMFFGLTEDEIEAIMEHQDKNSPQPKEESPWDKKLKEELDRGEDTWGRISKRYK